MKKYAYSNELKANTINADYDMAELALTGKMETSIKFIGFPVRHFKTKRALFKKKEFTASDGASIKYYEFTPKEPLNKYPAIIYYHGGGFMFPIQKPMMENSSIFAEKCQAKVFLPDYRYSPKVSCNRVMDDCFDMLVYVFEHAEELRIDTDRVILYGDSAGGCLAACVALRNRDFTHYPIKGQMLIYPVCDNESFKYESIEQYKYGVWSKKGNASMWRLYFHHGFTDVEYLVPAKNHCEDLPPAYVEPQEMDTLRDEAIAYASKLKAAGVKVECNLIGGSYHGFDADLKSPLVRRVMNHRIKVMNKMIQI